MEIETQQVFGGGGFIIACVAQPPSAVYYHTSRLPSSSIECRLEGAINHSRGRLGYI